MLCELVRRLCGVDLLQYKRGQMERRVRSFAQRRGTPDLIAYAGRLKADTDELEAFLDRVTINVSHLWRHEDQWAALGRTILPELGQKGRIRCWSAGSSYGAQAFDARRRRPGLGSRRGSRGHPGHRSGQAHDRARAVGPVHRRGRPYSTARTAEGWFDPADDGGWQAKAELLRMTRFEVGDLLRMPVQAGRYDLIMCRNTVIYFTEEVRDALHGGWPRRSRPAATSSSAPPSAYRPPRAGAHVTVPLHLPEEPDVMDISEYLPMFLAEGREHLQELNLAVVRIEEAPDDQDTVDEIFRIAHSMKGMSATMGFAGMAALTHEMEDVFELLRQRRGGLPREAIDVLLECLDALSAAVEAIDETGDEQIEPAPLIERLEGLVRERDAEQRGRGRAAAEPPVDLAELADGRRVVQVSATLSDDVQLPSVRAYMVLSALAELGETLACRPARTTSSLHRPRDRRLDRLRARRLRAGRRGRRGVRRRRRQVFEAVRRRGRDRPRSPTGPGTAEAAPKRCGGPAKGSATVRVDAERLDQLMHFMGELVLHRTQVEALAADADVPGLSQAMQNLTRTSHALQAMVMQVRMIPVEAVFLRFPRLVRDLSTKLGKQVELELVGKDTELDRTVVDALGDPLVHLIRNSLDHGLEGPEGASGRQAGHRHAPPGGPPRRRQRGHRGARRRPRHRPRQGRREGGRARA